MRAFFGMIGTFCLSALAAAATSGCGDVPEGEDAVSESALATVSAEWMPIQLAGGPSTPVISPMCTYDEARQRIVYFGGATGQRDNLTPTETWSFDGAKWAVVANAASSPPPREQAAMAYDSARDRVVLFGGRTSLGTVPTDVWELDGNTWKRIAVPAATANAKPLGRWGHSLAFDAARARTVLFGGTDPTNTTFHVDTWEWDGSRWENPGGASASGTPSPRRDAAAVYVPGEGVLLHGGFSNGGGPSLRDTHVWNGSGWTTSTNLGAYGRPPGLYASAAFDPAHGLVIHGIGGTGTFQDDVETWERRQDGWRALDVKHAPGTGCLAYFAKRGTIVSIDDRGRVSELKRKVVANRAPVIAPLSNPSLFVGETLRLKIDATDVDDTALNFSLKNAPAGATLEGDTVVWTPTQSGVYPLTVRVSDGTKATSRKVTVTVVSNGYALFPQGQVRLRAELIPIGGIFHTCQGYHANGCFDMTGGAQYFCELTGSNPGKIEVRCGSHAWTRRRSDGSQWSTVTVLRDDATFEIAFADNGPYSNGAPPRLTMGGHISLDASGDYFLHVDSFREDLNETEYVRSTSPARAQLAPF